MKHLLLHPIPLLPLDDVLLLWLRELPPLRLELLPPPPAKTKCHPSKTRNQQANTATPRQASKHQGSNTREAKKGRGGGRRGGRSLNEQGTGVTLKKVEGCGRKSSQATKTLPVFSQKKYHGSKYHHAEQNSTKICYGCTYVPCQCPTCRPFTYNT